MDKLHIVTTAQMRWADQLTINSGTSGFMLMDRAGLAVANAVLECMPDYGRVVIIAGGGNNGGDGFAAAYYLKQQRIPVTVVTLIPVAEINGDSRLHADRARTAGVKIREACSEQCLDELGRWLIRAVLVVDGVFGTGLSRSVDGRMRDIIERINRTDRPVISIDIASGVCADSGAVQSVAVRADYTVPIAATKWGHWLNEGRDYTGKLLDVADIGIDDASIHMAWEHSCEQVNDRQTAPMHSACVIAEKFLSCAWPRRQRLSHKGSYGHVWIFGGSQGFTGAPQLAALGAYAAGAGLASIACPDAVWPVIAAANLEVMTHPESTAGWQGADALVLGPGWGKAQGKVLSTMLKVNKPMVIDADALNIIAASESLQHQLCDRTTSVDCLTVMTPHPGEAARLLDMAVDEVQQDRKKSVMALTTRYGCWVVLKGSETLIASPAGDILLNPFGSAQLAVAGSGDVLAGMIGAQLARADFEDVSPAVMIAAAVALHGIAGERSSWYLAGELAKLVADLRQLIERGGKAD